MTLLPTKTVYATASTPSVLQMEAADHHGTVTVIPDRRLHRYLLAAAVVALLAAAGTGVAALARSAKNGSGPQEAVPLHSTLEAFPTETLQDVVTYSDVFAVLKVLSVRDLEPESIEDSHTSQMREVTVEVVETWWTRPGAPSVPRQLTLFAAGYDLEIGKRVPRTGSDLPWWETGKTYVGALAELRGEWVDANGNVFELSKGLIHPDRIAGAKTWALELGEASKSEVVSLLSRTAPDPRAQAIDPSLDPMDRAVIISSKPAPDE